VNCNSFRYRSAVARRDACCCLSPIPLGLGRAAEKYAASSFAILKIRLTSVKLGYVTCQVPHYDIAPLGSAVIGGTQAMENLTFPFLQVCLFFHFSVFYGVSNYISFELERMARVNT